MTPWELELLASQHRRQRVLEAQRERLAARTRGGRAGRETAGRRAATLGQLLAIRREAAVR